MLLAKYKECQQCPPHSAYRSGMKMLFHLSIVQIKMWFLPRSFVLGKQSSNSLSFHGSEPLLYFFLNNYCMSTGLDDKKKSQRISI